MSEPLPLLLAVLRTAFRDRSDLVAENLLLRHQLAVLTRPTRRRPRLHLRDRLLWVLTRRLLCCSGTSAPAAVRPHRVPPRLPPAGGAAAGGTMRPNTQG